MSDPFHLLLNLLCWYFIEHFIPMFNQWYWPVIRFLWCLGLFLVSDCGVGLILWGQHHLNTRKECIKKQPTKPVVLGVRLLFLVPSLGTYFSVSSFYLILSAYFCVSVCWLLFTILESAQVGDVLWGSAVHSPLVIGCICSRGTPYWTAWALLLLHGQLLWVCQWVRLTLTWLAAKPCFVGGCWSAG